MLRTSFSAPSREMFNCRSCHDALPKTDGDYALCSNCNQGFHFNCSVSESNWRKLGRKKDNWKCFECKSNVKNSDNTPEVMEVISEATPQVATEESMKKLFNTLSKEIKGRLDAFENSLAFNSKQMDDILTAYKEMKNTVQKLEVKQQKMERENSELKKSVRELKGQMIERDQRALERNLEIKGIPETIVEPKQIMNALCRKAGVTTPAEHTYLVERIKNGQAEKPKNTVIIKFESKIVRDSIFKSCKGKRPQLSDFTGNTSDNSAVYINEQLTPFNRKLFYEANLIKKEKNYAYLWFTDNKLLLKKTQDSRPLRVYDVEDMKKE